MQRMARRCARLSTLRDDRGSATILAVGIACALASVLLGLVMLISAVVHTHKAQVAADMAAVAGAFANAQGHRGCPAAVAVLEANNAAVFECVVDGEDVQVGAVVQGKRARARAGPL